MDCVQIMEGRGFKCHLVTDQGIGTCLEDEVQRYLKGHHILKFDNIKVDLVY